MNYPDFGRKAPDQRCLVPLVTLQAEDLLVEPAAREGVGRGPAARACGGALDDPPGGVEQLQKLLYALQQLSRGSAGRRKDDDLEGDAESDDGDEDSHPVRRGTASKAQGRVGVWPLYENVFPKRLGVEISTSENDFAQPFALSISGLDSDQSSR